MFPDSRHKYFRTKSTPPPPPSKCWACVGKSLALVWKFFTVHEDNIIYLSHDTEISLLLNISGMCLEISNICPEIWIVHRDCAIFYPMTQEFPDFSKFPACVRKFTACVWKFSDDYKFLECVRKFPTCVWKLLSYKNIIFVFYLMTQQISKLHKISSICLEVLSMY